MLKGWTLEEGMPIAERRRSAKVEHQERHFFAAGILWGILVVLVLAVGAGCAQQGAFADEWGVIVIPKGSKIKVGFAAALSGPYAKFGLDIKNGVQLAVAEKGQIQKFDVELQAEDDQGEVAPSVAVAKQFVADPLRVGAVAHLRNDGSVAASDIYNEARMVMISPSSTIPQLAQKGLPTFFRTSWDDAIQGKTAANYAAKTLKVKKVVVLDDGSAFGQGLSLEFKQGVEAAGVTVVAYEGVDQGETDLSSVIARIKPLGPDLVYFGGTAAQGSVIVRQMRRDEMAAVFMGGISGDGLFSGEDYVRDFIEASGGAAEGSYITYAKIPQGAKYADWKKRYESKYGPVGTFSAQGYDAAMILLNAVEKVAQVQGDGSLAIGKKVLADIIRSTRYSGVTGDIAFDDKGDRTNSAVVVNKVVGSKFQEVQ